MPTQSEPHIEAKIHRILQRNPDTSTLHIKQSLFPCGLKGRAIREHLMSFYQQGRVDDMPHIQRQLSHLMKERKGWMLIEKALRQALYNPFQVESVLSELSKSFDPHQQALLSKQRRFGDHPPKTPDERSKMLFYLQKEGHTLPVVMAVLRSLQDRGHF